jgi:Family of unknown function (DUF6502)
MGEAPRPSSKVSSERPRVLSIGASESQGPLLNGEADVDSKSWGALDGAIPMSEALKVTVRTAVLAVLQPLVKLLLDAGLGVGDVMSLVKVAYVKGASERHGKVGERANIGRIAVVTGLNRPEIAAILEQGEAGCHSTEHSRQRAERVLLGWWTDAEYLTAQGEPQVLALKGPRRSFEALCRRYGGEYRTGPMLEELLRVRAARRRTHDRIQALSRTYATVRWDLKEIAALGEALRDHCATLIANLEEPTRPRFARQVLTVRLDPRHAPALIRDIESHLRAEADSVQGILNRPLYRAAPGSAALRLGVGFYVFEGSSDLARGNAVPRAGRETSL